MHPEKSKIVICPGTSDTVLADRANPSIYDFSRRIIVRKYFDFAYIPDSDNRSLVVYARLDFELSISRVYCPRERHRRGDIISLDCLYEVPGVCIDFELEVFLHDLYLYL